ncbi:MAG: FkbM family methyltransferase [Parvularculaceae bacterium]|nr:FkbM family methyltransferase [Parvularculaceae bacterium]
MSDEESKMRGFSDALLHLKKLGYAPETVIDVGVAWGTPPLYETFSDAFFHLVEPLSKFDGAIGGILKTYKGRAYKAAAGEHAGPLTIRVRPTALGYAGASLSHAVAAQGEGAGQGENGEVEYYTFEVKRLDDIIDAETLTRPCLLKVDAQGFDLSVVRSGPKVLAACDIVIMETGVFPFASSLDEAERNTLANITGYMSQHGFCVYDIVSPLYRPYDAALSQVDLIFARADSALFKYKGW